MSSQCEAFDPNLDGILQRFVLRDGHSGRHQDEEGIEFNDDEAEC
jgi:hypothetical protein